MKSTKLRFSAALLLTAALVAGCQTFGTRSHQATSVMRFLYPGDTRHLEEASLPVLSLPVKVGIAFVPMETANQPGPFFSVTETALGEAQKMALMKEVSRHFRKYPFVKNIELIPTAYLTPGGSFVNLEQLRSMFGVDVIALLSYDQVQFTDEGFLALTYWTMVGAYAVEGEKNDTRTMLDAVVYDIQSRRMLFRAPGTSHVKGRSTPVNLSEELRRDSEEGFEIAATNLVSALEFQLGEFKERIKQSPEEIKVVHKPGYTGAAALGVWEATLAGAMLAVWLFRRRQK